MAGSRAQYIIRIHESLCHELSIHFYVACDHYQSGDVDIYGSSSPARKLPYSVVSRHEAGGDVSPYLFNYSHSKVFIEGTQLFHG